MPSRHGDAQGGQEGLDPVFDVVADDAHGVETLASGVVELQSWSRVPG